MVDTVISGEALREKILADPNMILEDPDVMRALVAARERGLGENIVDLRGLAMERLEARLDRLEDTHRSVIAAAYENLAGTNQVQRAVLKMLDPVDFEGFMKSLGTDVAEILRVDSVRVVIETAQDPDDPALRRLGDVLCVADAGFVERYMTAGRPGPARAVTLRAAQPIGSIIYGDAAVFIRSEALMRLDFGPGRLPGMLAMGAEDAQQFRSTQGTDLLAFFSGVFERQMRRWLS